MAQKLHAIDGGADDTARADFGAAFQEFQAVAERWIAARDRLAGAFDALPAKVRDPLAPKMAELLGVGTPGAARAALPEPDASCMVPLAVLERNDSVDFTQVHRGVHGEIIGITKARVCARDAQRTLDTLSGYQHVLVEEREE